MRRQTPFVAWAFAVLAIAAAPAAPSFARSPARPRSPACFGGPAEPAASGLSDPKGLTMVGGHLYWSGAGLQRLDPRTGVVTSVDPTFHSGISDVGPIDARAAYAVTNGADLLAFDQRSKTTRVLVPGELSATRGTGSVRPPFALDDRYVYYSRSGDYDPSRDPRLPLLGTGFYRIRRDGDGRPEFLGSPPAPGWIITIDGGFVYYRYGTRSPERRFTIVRRALAAGSQPEEIVHLQRPGGQAPMQILAARLYYVDDDALWSVPAAGGAAPVRLAAAGGAEVTDLLAEAGCLYWADGRKIRRLALGDGGAAATATPEIIADERDYQEAAHQITGVRRYVLATDGRFLYWPDVGGDRIMRARCDPRPQPARGELVAAWTRGTPRAPATAEKLAVGDGWGCARFREGADDGRGGGRHWQCWTAAPPGAPAAARIAARPIPWLLGDALYAGPDRLCAPVGDGARCWPWPAAAAEPRAPADAPAGRAAWSDGRWLHVGGTFACTYPSSVWSCFGDDAFGQLGDGRKDVAIYAGPGALGTWHGCATLGADGVLCWGRGDAGQLGFAPPETCGVGADRVPCSRTAHPVPFAVPTPSYLVAGDMFTCAVSSDRVPRCWGGSRDGLFGDAAACPPALRSGWPTRTGRVPAPAATCSPTPAAVPGLTSPTGWVTAGPRGICADAGGGRAHCAGAIPSPDGAVHDVAVGAGDQPAACGIAGADAVCWGAGYSPPDRPGAPAHVDADRTPVAGAAVLDSPPRDAAEWASSCRIHFGCEHATPALPDCAPGASAQPWSDLVAQAPALVGTTVRVRGPLVVGLDPGQRGRGYRDLPGGNVSMSVRCGPSECCNHRPLPIVIGGAEAKLALAALECTGDDSRACCNAPALGQTVIAVGALQRSRAGDWRLDAPQVCAVAAGPP
jgi:hypothetical protein